MWLDLRDNRIQTFKCSQSSCSLQLSNVFLSDCWFRPPLLQSNVFRVAETTWLMMPGLLSHSSCHQFYQLSLLSCSSVKPTDRHTSRSISSDQMSHARTWQSPLGSGGERGSQDKGGLAEENMIAVHHNFQSEIEEP